MHIELWRENVHEWQRLPSLCSGLHFYTKVEVPHWSHANTPVTATPNIRLSHPVPAPSRIPRGIRGCGDLFRLFAAFSIGTCLRCAFSSQRLRYFPPQASSWIIRSLRARAARVHYAPAYSPRHRPTFRGRPCHAGAPCAAARRADELVTVLLSFARRRERHLQPPHGLLARITQREAMACAGLGTCQLRVPLKPRPPTCSLVPGTPLRVGWRRRACGPAILARSAPPGPQETTAQRVLGRLMHASVDICRFVEGVLLASKSGEVERAVTPGRTGLAARCAQLESSSSCSATISRRELSQRKVKEKRAPLRLGPNVRAVALHAQQGPRSLRAFCRTRCVRSRCFASSRQNARRRWLIALAVGRLTNRLREA